MRLCQQSISLKTKPLTINKANNLRDFFMKSKTLLSLMLESLVNGDKGQASNYLSTYLTRKVSPIVNEADYDYDYDYDSVEYDSTETLTNEKASFEINGVGVVLTYGGVQAVATYTENERYHYHSEIVKYGPIKVSYLETMEIGGEAVFDGIAILDDVTADKLRANVDAYAKEIYDAIVETNEIDSLPQNIMQTATPQFCKQVILNFAQDLENREGDA